MARPGKFRLTPDDVLEPGNARKLAGHVSEIEFFRAEVEKLQAQIAGVYDAADDDGFDKKFIRKAVARRAKDSDELASEEAAVDAYTFAVAKGLATRTREENPKTDLPEHDATTGEILETDEQFSAGVQIMRDRAASQSEPAGDLEILDESTASEPNVSAALSTETAQLVTAPIPPRPETAGLPEATASGDKSPATATQSTAARMDVRVGQNHVERNKIADGGEGSAPDTNIARPQAGTQAQPVDTPSHADLTDKPGAEQSAPAPLARLKTTDEVADDMGLPAEAHPGCRKPKICGRFSHKGLCAICRGEDREAA